jgi:hypothetical protein
MSHCSEAGYPELRLRVPVVFNAIDAGAFFRLRLP